MLAFQLSLISDPWDNLELFVDGKPQTRARYPNIAANDTWMWSGYENMRYVR